MAEPEDLMSRIGRVGARIDPALTERDVERLIRRAAARRAQRRMRARALAIAGIAMGAAGAGVVAFELGHGGREPAVVALPTPAARPSAAESGGVPVLPEHPLRLSDGSTATPLGADAALAVREDSQARVAIDLGRGRGRFDVVPNRQRVFEVHAGEVSVHVVGTVFSVERVADRVGVSVERGAVRVDWKTGARALTAGESGWFPPLQIQPSAAMDGPAGSPTAAADSVPARPAGRADGSRQARTADQLLRAADAERLAGHPEEGARLLRRLLHDHRGDPRAPLGALTLGRLLMIELARPRQAAAAFADARILAPRGPFAEDALAREVEAWSKAGDTATAAKRARLYLDRYPNGHRADTVKAFGGVE